MKKIKPTSSGKMNEIRTLKKWLINICKCAQPHYQENSLKPHELPNLFTRMAKMKRLIILIVMLVRM